MCIHTVTKIPEFDLELHGPHRYQDKQVLEHILKAMESPEYHAMSHPPRHECPAHDARYSKSVLAGFGTKLLIRVAKELWWASHLGGGDHFLSPVRRTALRFLLDALRSRASKRSEKNSFIVCEFDPNNKERLTAVYG